MTKIICNRFHAEYFLYMMGQLIDSTRTAIRLEVVGAIRASLTAWRINKTK